MSFRNWEEGNRFIERIVKGIKSGNISHAYIFEGDSSIDKIGFAKDFLAAVFCQNDIGYGCESCLSCRKILHENSEDLLIVQADGLTLKDEKVELVLRHLNRKPIGPRNMVIIADADTMTPKAQNHLLKTLEEPAGPAIILLLSENEENLLKTIRSRCVVFRMHGAWEQIQSQKIYDAANHLIDALLEKESFFALKEILSKYVKSKTDALQILDAMEKTYRNILIGKDERSSFFRAEVLIKNIYLIEEAREDLRINVKETYALRNLVLKIGG